MPAVFDRYSNSFLKIYFPIPAGREDEIARKVLIKHLQSGNSYGIALKERHCKFPQPELGPWVRGVADRGHRLEAAGARGMGASAALTDVDEQRGGPPRCRDRFGGGGPRSVSDAASAATWTRPIAGRASSATQLATGGSRSAASVIAR